MVYNIIFKSKKWSKYLTLLFMLMMAVSCAQDIVDVTGTITGTIKDNTTNQTVENVIVSISPSGNSMTTSADGRYTFQSLQPNTYTITCSKVGYQDQTVSVELVAGKTINRDILIAPMGPFNVNVSTLDFGDLNTSLSFVLRNNTQSEYDFTIANDIPWFKTAYTEGRVQANNQLNITATVDRSLVGYGSFERTISINYTGQTSGNVIIRVLMSKVQQSAPTVETQIASNITATSFSIGGTISSTGGTTITSYGHCWSTTPNPTIADQHSDFGKTIETLTFTSDIKQLLANTVVYVRAYATNAYGTSYGNEVQITTPKGNDPNTGDNGTNNSFAGGTGTVFSPYQVATAAQMQLMKDYPSAYFVLTADIDMDGFFWVPFELAGGFDGQNHTIYNLTISPYVTTDQVGLFSNLKKNVCVKNLSIVGLNIDMPQRNKVGAITGSAQPNTQIQNCHITLNNGSKIVGKNYVGGIAGYVYSVTITDCSVKGNESQPQIMGNSYVGGAVGYSEQGDIFGTSITQMYIYAGTEHVSYVGGVLGFARVIGGSVTVDDCVFNGRIDAAASGTAGYGGILGGGQSGTTISNSNAYVIINATGCSALGGITYTSYGSGLYIVNCNASGSINGQAI